MITGQEQPIEAPKLVKRRWGLLTDIAEELVIESRGKVTAPGEDTPMPPLQLSNVGRGVTFTPMGCGQMQVIEAEFCDDTASEDHIDIPERPVFEAFTVRALERCSALDIDVAWLNGRINQRWAATISTYLAAELERGGHSGASPTFVNSGQVIWNTPEHPLVALALVEAGLAQSLQGAEGMVHVNPAVMPLIAVALERDGDRWRTYNGHVVVSDAGYAGTPPTGHSGVDGELWIYGSGPVGYKLGPPRPNQDANQYLDRTRNLINGRKLADAVVAFDPCAVITVPAAVYATGS